MNTKKTNRIFNLITALVVVAIGFFAYLIFQKEAKSIETIDTITVDEDVTGNPLDDADSLIWNNTNSDSLVSPATDNPIVETARKQRSTMDKYKGRLVGSDNSEP
jgi:hypothetical protein